VDKATELAYVASWILFIFGIKRLGKVRTARQGNLIAAVAMLIAVVAAVVHFQSRNGLLDIQWGWIVAGLAIGSVVGVVAAKRVPMTGMPEMVALFNGSGGAASALVALAYLWNKRAQSYWAPEVTMADFFQDPGTALALMASVMVGGITLTGSLVAFGKLSGRMTSNAVVFPRQHLLNLLLIVLMIGVALSAAFLVGGGGAAGWLTVLVAVVSLVLGVLLVIPIGGADMPVVISLLNSYSGVAAAMTGFVIQESVLIISGAMVGAAGLILTTIMCKAMNRSLVSVLLGGFGATTTGATKGDDGEYKNVRSIGSEELAMMLDGVGSVIVVPGYGLAVAQAQHAVRELADFLESRGAQVRYAIHPVAGRMPGHMNVLLAESNVPHEKLVEMDEINPDFKTTDVVLVLGANDVVNPAAIDDKTSPLAGMPILMVHEARNVVVIKRSLSPGYAGVKNRLFERDNTVMFYADAKVALQETLRELKETAVA
jgi:NAD(P) transhydrogenase subunit beta